MNLIFFFFKDKTFWLNVREIMELKKIIIFYFFSFKKHFGLQVSEFFNAS